MPQPPSDNNASELFNYFYLIHFQLNMAIEDVMRGSLSRKEAALMLLLHSEGGKTACLPRRIVVERFSNWFEATSSNVTKIISRLSSDEIDLVKVSNEKGSARDKQISLTSNGKRTLRAMLKRGAAQTQVLMQGIPAEDIKLGLEFFSKASSFTNTIMPLNPLDAATKK